MLNSNVPHKLSDSEYNTRVKECNNAFDVISKKYSKYNFLAEIPEKIIYEFKDELNDKVYNRALYVSQENQRTIKSAELISKGLYSNLVDLYYYTRPLEFHDILHLKKCSFEFSIYRSSI